MANVREAMVRLQIRLRETVCKKYAKDAEDFAKANAPWKDQTGTARKMLRGGVIDDGDSLGIRVMHRVKYGKSLEKDGSGRYAILKPTIEHFRQPFFDSVRRCLGG